MPPRLWQAPALRCRTSSRPSVGRHRQRRSGTGNAGLPARVTEHGGRHAAQHHASHRQRTGGCPGRPLVVVVGPPGAGAAVAGRRGRLGGAAGHGSHRPADRAEQPGEPARTTQAPRPGRGRAAALREIDLSPRNRGRRGAGVDGWLRAQPWRRRWRRPAIHPQTRAPGYAARHAVMASQEATIDPPRQPRAQPLRTRVAAKAASPRPATARLSGSGTGAGRSVSYT